MISFFIHRSGRFFYSGGFTLIGVLTASTIGVIVVIGLARFSATITDILRKSQKKFDIILLSGEIKEDLMSAVPLPDPSCTPPLSDECLPKNVCTNSLRGYEDKLNHEQFVQIKSSSSKDTDISALYMGGQVVKGVKIQEIKFKAGAEKDGKANLSIIFSFSDDPRDTLSAPAPVEFQVHITGYEGTSNKIQTCSYGGGGGGGGVSSPLSGYSQHYHFGAGYSEISGKRFCFLAGVHTTQAKHSCRVWREGDKWRLGCLSGMGVDDTGPAKNRCHAEDSARHCWANCFD